MKHIDNCNELAKLAGVSHNTNDKGRAILKSDNEGINFPQGRIGEVRDIALSKKRNQ